MLKNEKGWDCSVSYGTWRFYTCTQVHGHTHTHTHNWNLEWIPAAFACLHTIYPFLIIKPFLFWELSLFQLKLSITGHMISPGTGFHLPGQCERPRSGRGTQSEFLRAAIYSLYVKLGLFASQRLCHLIHRVMLSLLSALLGS